MTRWLTLAILCGFIGAPVVRAEDQPAEAPVHAGKNHAEKDNAEKPAAAGHVDAGHANAGHGDEHAGGHAGKPALPLNFKADLAIWSVVTFLVFLFVLKKLAWKPLIDGMNAREEKVRKDIADAEANRAKSETLFREYESKLAKAQEEVKAILAEARRDAETAKADIMATAEKESAAMRQRAVAEIDRARDQAMGELFDFVSKNVMQATEQIVGRSLTGPDQERLVKEALANLDLRKN